MQSAATYCISFCGITVRFVFPTPVEVPEEFSAFLCEDCDSLDAEYEVRLLSEPLCPAEPPVCDTGGIKVYQTDQGWLRIYSPLIEEDGCQVACFLSPGGRNKLYYPASKWDFYAAPFRCIHLIGGEVLLLRHNAFLLHSSVVQINGKTVLFSGASGAGKSTQARLWEKHLGAEILNGDRCVIMKRADGFYGGGSPWAGTSGVYRREQAPIAGIFLLGQSQDNSIRRLGMEAFAPLFCQTIVNSWDPQFMAKVLQLFTELLSQIPVYRLDCRPDETAVDLAYRTLF